MTSTPMVCYSTGQPSPGGEAGFTLLELIITMAIAAILLTMAVPSFQTTIANNRLATQTNNLVTDINIARSEAVKRGTDVVLCSSADPNAAAPTCIGNGNAWTSGWIVFVNGTGDTNPNQFATATDTLIKVSQAIGGTATILTAGALNTFTYNGNGANAAAANADFFICDDRGEAFARQVQIRPTGRPRLIGSPLPAGSCP
ncbi:MAG TPA: prepilin-type N-terminal cleavage/methylation domain-containing protein [Gammaproteobacteria bacterium]|nr:prepilin-type N-terminal cleavage/methylation domain-containing protein [Gammaproteobacteria bacterium]